MYSSLSRQCFFSHGNCNGFMKICHVLILKFVCTFMYLNIIISALDVNEGNFVINQ